ncbi:MAG: cell envelope integrity protein TolA, partial [Clostridiales bacterium]|nr:cell envelope integrity protein TolA [Clostridiales bacterium]
MTNVINDYYGLEVSANQNAPESNMHQYEAKRTMDNEAEEEDGNDMPRRSDEDEFTDYDLEDDDEEPENEVDDVIYPEPSEPDESGNSPESFYDSEKLARENEFGASELNATNQFSGEFGEMKTTNNSQGNDYISFNGMAGDDSSNARSDFENQPDIIFGNSNENSLFDTYSENDNSLESNNENQFQDILGFGSLGINSDNDFLGFSSFSNKNNEDSFNFNGFGNDTYMAGIFGLGALGVGATIDTSQSKYHQPPVAMNGAFTDALKKAVNMGKEAVVTVGEKLASKAKTVAKNVYDEHIASPDIYDKLGENSEANRIRDLRLKKAEEKQQKLAEKQQKLAEKQKYDDAVTQYKLRLDRTKHPEKYDENGELKEPESSKPTVLNYVKNRGANLENEFKELTDDSFLVSREPVSRPTRSRSTYNESEDISQDSSSDSSFGPSQNYIFGGLQNQQSDRYESSFFADKPANRNTNRQKPRSSPQRRDSEFSSMKGIPLEDTLGFGFGNGRESAGYSLDDTLGFGQMSSNGTHNPANQMRGISLAESLGFGIITQAPIRSQRTKENITAFKKKNKTSSQKRTKKTKPVDSRIPDRSAYDEFMKKPEP